MTNRFKFIFTLLWLLACVPTALYADIPTNSVTPENAYPISPVFEYLEDSGDTHSFDSIKQQPDDSWTQMSSKQASFGFNDSTFWVRTLIVNNTPEVKNFILGIDYTLLDFVDFQGTKTSGDVIELSTGDMRAFYPRHVDHPSNLFSFQLAPNGSLPIYIRVKTQGSLIIPLQLWEAQALFESAAVEQQFHFFYYGAITFIILINLAVFITLRERLYLYYATAIAGYLIFFATSRGYFQQLFSGDYPELSSRIFLISMPALALFSILFAREFLKSAQTSRKLDYVLKAMVVFEIINLLLAFFAPYNLVVKVSAIGAVLLFTTLFIAGPITYIKRRRSGLYFTIAWTPLTIGFFATSGRTSGFLPNTFFTEYAMQIGSGIEALVLTLALADRLFRERENKIKAQAESIRVEKQRNLTQKLLTESMSRDPVSKLSNRNRFELLVDETIKENPDKKYIVAVAKLSRLDDITRTLGLSGAEKIIKIVARQLNQQQGQLSGIVSFTNDNGEKECVYQLSRDSFGSILSQEAFEQNPEPYIDVLRQTAQPIEVEGLYIDLAPLYGSAFYPEHGTEPSQLIRNALIAVGESRHSKEMIGVFQEKLDVYDEGRLSLVTQLREALENNELQLYYQPKLDVVSDNVVGMEALARWQHPARGAIPPDEFIQLAEESGLINQLTLWAIETAIIDLQELQGMGYQGSVSINVSARDLLKKSFVGDVQAILDKHRVAAASVYLELTETQAMEDPKIGIATLSQLAALGVRIAVDDFGTGYSSLSYLQRLPATEVKLDRSLTREICQCESTAIIVKASVDMAHALGYSIVAEGVEDEATRDQLRQYGCNTYQGFWSCKPLPIDNIVTWLKARTSSPQNG